MPLAVPSVQSEAYGLVDEIRVGTSATSGGNTAGGGSGTKGGGGTTGGAAGSGAPESDPPPHEICNAAASAAHATIRPRVVIVLPVVGAQPDDIVQVAMGCGEAMRRPHQSAP